MTETPEKNEQWWLTCTDEEFLANCRLTESYARRGLMIAILRHTRQLQNNAIAENKLAFWVACLTAAIAFGTIVSAIFAGIDLIES